MKEIVRERNFTWDAPAATASAISGREPLSWMREMQAGIVPSPPASRFMGFDCTEVEPGRIVFTMRAQEWMANPTGVLHGGMVSTLLDTVLTLAVQTQLPKERYCTTIDLHVHMVRPIQPDGELVQAEGLAVHVGTTIATAEGRAHDARGRLVAHATATLAILDPNRR
jgi:uncharacterized protein (TIGR00369 family)